MSSPNENDVEVAVTPPKKLKKSKLMDSTKKPPTNSPPLNNSSGSNNNNNNNNAEENEEIIIKEKKEKKKEKEEIKDKKLNAAESAKRKDSFGKPPFPAFLNSEEKEKKIKEDKKDEKKELIKEEKKLEKKQAKEEKKREKEEEKRKEKEERQREKEEKKSAEQKRAARKEKRKSFLKSGEKGMEVAISESLQPAQTDEGKEEKWQKTKPSYVNSPEVAHTQRELEQFLLNIPMKKLRGTTWTYYDIAPATGYTETMILLHSGGIRPELMFEHILGFAKHFRVIAPWFPEYFNEIADYPAGLSLIMRHENIKRAHFFGIGFGAVVANYFLYKHPSRVITCSLAHSTLPMETKVKACDKALKKGDFSYGAMYRILSGNSVKPKELEEHVLDLIPAEKEMWLRNFKKFSATKQALTVRTEAMRDYHTSVTYKPADFERWEGKIFLIESEDDEYYDKENFVTLKSLFPNSYVHYISGSGHLLLLIRGQFVVDLILKFIFDEENLTNRTDLSHKSKGEDSELEEEKKNQQNIQNAANNNNNHENIQEDKKQESEDEN